MTKTKFGRRVRTVDISEEWDDKCQESFELLRDALVKYPILRIPDTSKPFIIMSDASANAIGAVLMQLFEDGLHPVAYFSKKFSKAESNYKVHEQELLAIFKSLGNWKYLLLGNTVTLYTDHLPLTYLKTQPTLSPRQYRWLTYFSDFDVEIVAVEGTKNVVADALSRYGYGMDLSNTLEKIRVEFLRKSLQVPAEVNMIYEKSGFFYVSPNTITGLTTNVLTNDIGTPEFHNLDLTDPTDQQKVLNIKEVLKDSYESDPIAKSVLTGNPLSYRYTLNGDNIVLYTDASGSTRIYIPPNASCIPADSATDFPIEGEVVREKSSLREELIRDVHINGHVGRDKTLDLMTRCYFWPGMVSHISSFVKGCKVCQQNKSVQHRPHGSPSSLEVPNVRWAHIGMDFITQLPKTSSGYDSIFVVVDKLSKRAHFIPTTTTVNAAQVADLFYKHVFKHHGMPLKIVSDRDSKFTGKFWQSLFKKLGSRLAMSTAFRPQTDGQVERTNKTLEELLRCFSDNNHRTWDLFLPAAEFQYNNTVHSSHGFTPFLLDTGFHPRDPHLHVHDSIVHSSLQQGSLIDLTQTALDNYHMASDKFADAWQMNLNFTKQCLNDVAARMDLAMAGTTKLQRFEKNSYVWLSTEHISLRNADGKLAARTTFDKRRMGPYKILEVLSNGNAYKLDLPSHQHFHDVQPVSRLELVKESTVFPDAHRTVPPLPIASKLGDQFEVEKIVSHRRYRGRLQYEVKYKGYGDTFNEFKNISSLRDCTELVDNYNSIQPAVLNMIHRIMLFEA